MKLIEPLSNSFGLYYDIERVIYEGKSEFQSIKVVETPEFGKVLLLDDITQVAEKREFDYHELTVHPAMHSAPSITNVLIIGGGDGGCLREVVKYIAVDNVDLVDLDSQVTDIILKYIPSIPNGAFNDARVHTVFADGRLFLEKCATNYDVIIMDMVDPYGGAKALYTKEFFTIVRNHLTNKGVFIMHTESPVTTPKVFGSITKTLSAVFKSCVPFCSYVQMYGTLWSVAVCREREEYIIDGLYKHTYNSEGLQLYSYPTHFSMSVLPPYVEKALNQGTIITDASGDFDDCGLGGQYVQ